MARGHPLETGSAPVGARGAEQSQPDQVVHRVAHAARPDGGEGAAHLRCTDRTQVPQRRLQPHCRALGQDRGNGRLGGPVESRCGGEQDAEKTVVLKAGAGVEMPDGVMESRRALEGDTTAGVPDDRGGEPLFAGEGRGRRSARADLGGAPAVGQGIRVCGTEPVERNLDRERYGSGVSAGRSGTVGPASRSGTGGRVPAPRPPRPAPVPCREGPDGPVTRAHRYSAVTG